VRTVNLVNRCAACLPFGNHSLVKNMIKGEWSGLSLLFYGNLFRPRSPPQPSSEVNYKICRCYNFVDF